MGEMTTVDVLNQLLAIHSRSLPTYLRSAPPWYGDEDSEAVTVLRHIADDHALMVAKIGSEILREGGVVKGGEFPMLYTDMHDLSIEYILRQVVLQQESEMEVIRSCVSKLQHAPAARALAEEALGAAQGHLDNLNSLESVSA